MSFSLNKLSITVLLVLSQVAVAQVSTNTAVKNTLENSAIKSTDNAYRKPDNQLDISKVKIELKKNQKSDFFTVYNKSDSEASGFTLEVYKWS